jgi:MFS-type transporter involved in bile tolerance (Atg22 family)
VGLANGISFAIQAALLLMIGAWADYGTSRPNITIFFTILAVAVSFAWLGVEDPAQWQAGVALYILGCERLDFWTANILDDGAVITYQAHTVACRYST